jgi:Divergent InlB B-repeat domain
MKTHCQEYYSDEKTHGAQASSSLSAVLRQGLSKFFFYTLIVFESMAYSSPANSESVQLRLENVNSFQDDGWSCGVHSAYRALAGGYAQAVDYVRMRSTITPLNPFRIVLLPGLLEPNISFEQLRIGQSTTALASSLSANYLKSATYRTASKEQLQDLLWSGRPTLVLIQNGVLGLGSARGCLGLEVAGTCVGGAVSVNGDAPTLHWILAVGYDKQSLFYKDTDSNDTRKYSWANLGSMRDWSFRPFNRDIGNAIRSKGTNPEDVVYFDEPILSERIARKGDRYPTLSVQADGLGRGTISSDSTPSCTSECSHPLRIGTVVHITAKAKAGSTFDGWEGDCVAQINVP